MGFKILPKNYLADWGEFESWASGVASAPDGWVIASSPIIARESTNIKFGTYGALVNGTNGIGGLYRTIPNGSDYAGRTFKLGVWGKSTSTGPYIELNDGVTSRTVHLDGSNAFVFTTTPAMKLDYSATQIRINLFSSLAATAYFDGAVLCEGEDLFLALDDSSSGQKYAISDWQPSLNMKQDQYEIANREGSFIPDNHLQSRNIRMRGSVVGTDSVSTRTHFDDLMKSIMSWKSTDKRHLYLHDDRYTDVFLKTFDWSYENSLKFINFNMQFSAPDSTTKSLARYRNRTVISGTVTEFSFNYDGTAESRPIITFIADQAATITTCQLENLTTQENIVYTGTVPTNVTLEIDCENGTILNNSVNRVSDFGTSDFIKLVRGTNYFRFSGSNCTINIDYYNRYL